MKLIAYYHEVTSDRRGTERHGLEAQRIAVANWVARGRDRVIASYTETKTTKRSDQPELRKALAHAQRAKATLLIARIEPLLHNCDFFDDIYKWEVEFIALDFAGVNRETLHVFAIVARNEKREKSERIRATLAARRARGERLGNPANLDPHSARRGRTLGSQKVAEMARMDYADLLPLLRSLRAGGLSLRAIADHLNREGKATRRGYPWNHNQVKRILDRYRE